VAARRANEKSSNFITVSLKTGKWTDFAPGRLREPVMDYQMSPDYRYFYFTTSGSEPKAVRFRISDQTLETITSLKDFSLGGELRTYSDQCRARRLSHLHPRHRLPGNLRLEYPLAIIARPILRIPGFRVHMAGNAPVQDIQLHSRIRSAAWTHVSFEKLGIR
jgi:hypothetical protein